MKEANFFNNVKEKFLEVTGFIVSWIKDNKKIAIILTSLLSIMLICIILLVSISGKDKKPKEVHTKELELSRELVIPNGPELPRDYTISRQPGEKWTDEEAEKWFSIPSETDISGLSKVNDNIINDILKEIP